MTIPWGRSGAESPGTISRAHGRNRLAVAKTAGIPGTGQAEHPGAGADQMSVPNQSGDYNMVIRRIRAHAVRSQPKHTLKIQKALGGKKKSQFHSRCEERGVKYTSGPATK